MLEAISHRKLPQQVLDMEDVLTSCVFGTLVREEFRSLYLMPFLRQAQNLNGDRPLQGIPEGVQINVSFWPWLQGNEQGCQPDVVIDFKEHAKLMVEAKHLSGKSNRIIDIDEEKSANCEVDCLDDLRDKVILYADQLTREWDVLLNTCQSTHSQFLVYLTAHHSFPYSDVAESLKEIRSTVTREIMERGLLWLSWRDLYSLLEMRRDRDIENLWRYMNHLGLYRVREVCTPRPITWRYQGKKAAQ